MHRAASLSLLVLASCAGPRAHEGDRVPAGLLGFPIGTYLQLEGVRAEHGKVGERTLRVERVGGRALPHPVGIWIENLSLPAGEPCVLSGYESGRWIGLPTEVRIAEHLEEHQAMWQFQRYFIATSVQAPPALVKSFEGPARER
ncbi:MAG: hypothetical protein HZA53_04950 [Planctomycetes bacterium]|nr:hypothetical protein [Planctomycetota bacterium]